MICAEFVLESLRAKAKYPASGKLRGKNFMDPISDMFSKIRNALMAKKESVSIPYSKFKLEIAKFLQKKDFIKDIKKRGRKNKKFIKLIFAEKEKLNNIVRISKPSRRIYAGRVDLKPYRDGFGAYIISTSQGLLDEKEAKKLKVGGEVVGAVY